MIPVSGIMWDKFHAFNGEFPVVPANVYSNKRYYNDNLWLSDEGELYIAKYKRAVGELDISWHIGIQSLITLLHNDEN